MKNRICVRNWMAVLICAFLILLGVPNQAVSQDQDVIDVVEDKILTPCHDDCGSDQECKDGCQCFHDKVKFSIYVCVQCEKEDGDANLPPNAPPSFHCCSYIYQSWGGYYVSCTDDKSDSFVKGADYAYDYSKQENWRQIGRDLR